MTSVLRIVLQALTPFPDCRIVFAMTLESELPETTTIVTATGDEWWRSAVIYQIYPRSFADSDGNGVGDLPGITHRLPALAELGVDAVWLDRKSVV